MAEDSASTFAAFRETVFRDHALLLRLRPAMDREPYVTHIAAVGAERGFVFDEAEVRVAMKEGEMAWLMLGADPV